MEGSVGMPINVQIATMKWRDEECLAVMKILEDNINFMKVPNL